MILPSGHATDYLKQYRDGAIEQGLGIGCDLDNYLRWKRGQINIVLGHDNVGKTDWKLWYNLALSTQHDIKHCLWLGENHPAQAVRKLIQMLAGKPFSELNHSEIRRFEMKIEYWFTFVDNKKLYTPKQLLDIFDSSNADSCLMDPFTGLDRGMNHTDNYQFMNESRLFCNQTGKTLDIITHPNTESGRTSMIYPQGHNWFGHLMPPMKAHIEGGKPFLNRVDDMIVIHRLTKHQDMRYFTMINVEKVKNNETGGQQTLKDQPVMFEFNKGLGYKCGLDDPIKRTEGVKRVQSTMEFKPMNGFEQSDFDRKSSRMTEDGEPKY